MYMLQQKIQRGNISDVYEFEIPQLVLTSSVDLNIADCKGGIVLDWSTYDITDKYFVIYRKEDSNDWKTIVGLDEKFNNNKFIDILGNDKNVPSIPNVDIIANGENNNIDVTVNAIDSGTKYYYYIEAYDSTSGELVAISNVSY